LFAQCASTDSNAESDVHSLYMSDCDDDGSSTEKLKDTPTQMRTSLPTLARECDRWGVSHRSAAAIASAVLQDVGIIDDEDCISVIDPSKVRRERKKNRELLQDNYHFAACGLQGLYFDGRKDKTRQQVMREGGAYHPVESVESMLYL
jgi:hypothetical protein